MHILLVIADNRSMPTSLASPTRLTAAPSISRQILSLALPALGALIAEPIFILIDSAMVGHLGTAPLGGLGVASSIVQTVVYLFVFLLFSTTTRAAQAYGRRDITQALNTGIQAVYLAVFIGSALAAFLFFAAPWVLSFFESSPESIPHALAYLRSSAPGVVGMFVVMAATGTLRGMHDTRAALVVSTVGAAVNIALNAFFIYGLQMGVAGSGLGTSITQLLMATALVVFMGAHAHHLHIKFAPTSPAEAPTPSLRSQVALRPSVAGVRASVRDGAWLFVRTLALRIALMATLLVATQLGVLALASHHIAWTVSGFMAFALDSLAIAGQTLFATAAAAQERSALPHGADDTSGNSDDTEVAPQMSSNARDFTPSPQAELLRVLTRWGLWVGAGLGAFLALLSPVLPRFFSTDPDVISATFMPLLIASATMPLASVTFLYDGILMGADRASYLAKWGMALLFAHLPALWFVGLVAPSMSTNVALSLLWAEYSLVFLGGRSAYLWWGSRDLRA